MKIQKKNTHNHTHRKQLVLLGSTLTGLRFPLLTLNNRALARVVLGAVRETVCYDGRTMMCKQKLGLNDRTRRERKKEKCEEERESIFVRGSLTSTAKANQE